MLLRRMADFQPLLVQDAYTSLGATHAEYMKAHNRWVFMLRSKKAPKGLPLYEAVLGPPDTQRVVPVGDAEVTLRVKEPGGQERSLPAALADPREGRYTAAVRLDQSGVYVMTADVRRGTQSLGSAVRPTLVGGADVELAEPRLNEAVLRRIADATHGQYLRAEAAASLPGLLRQSEVGQQPTEMRDLWHNGFSLAVIVGLLAAEWLVRRRVGLA